MDDSPLQQHVKIGKKKKKKKKVIGGKLQGAELTLIHLN
jgi:hypothetical protein